MKVYIASKYIENCMVNRKIYQLLLDSEIETFLPESIEIDAISPEEEKLVGDKCYEELRDADVIIFVSPYGDSVIAEVGAAVISRIMGHPKKILLFGKQRKNEAMISPYIDYIIDQEERRSEEDYLDLVQMVRSLAENRRQENV